MVADSRSGKWRPFKRAAGLPDLFMLHDDPPRMIVAEVKGDGGKLSDKQREFLQMAQTVGSLTGGFDAPEWAYTLADKPKPKRSMVLGVYAWTPADQDIIEGILKSKVLL